MNIDKAYNLWAEQYDTNKNKTRDLDQKVTIKVLEKYEFNTLVELGCGTGKNTAFFLKKAEKIVGLDFSEGMLKIAKHKIKSEKVNFKQCNLTKAWEIEPNFADLISCNLTLEHIKNLNFIFEQANNTLKDVGYFFVCELHPFKQYLGSKARFETENGTQELQTFTHHASEYIDAAQNNGFQLLELNEWFDNREAEKSVPRLISFVFKKIN